MSALATNPEVFFTYIDPFIDYRQTVYEVSEQTTKSNIIDINLFRKYMNKQKCKEITGQAVMEFQMYLKKQRENTGRSMNRKLFSLRSYSTFLKNRGLEGADKLPFKDILKIRLGYSNGPQALTMEQVKRLFKNINTGSYLGIRDYCVYGFMYGLGLRVGEVHSLKVHDIELKKKKVTVTGKGNKERTLQITNEMAGIITDWLAVRDKFLNSDKSDSLFISKKGNPLAIRTMEDNFKKIIETSTVNVSFNITPHTLRHSCASHLNDEGVDILVLQRILGHSTPRSTEIYIHPSEKKVREALERLPSVVYLNELVETGVVRFQKGYGKKPGIVVTEELVT
ncbi:MAG: tyrosine-type recombinase/integrase [Elusimicrobia bacterium]|nr:tyrosine-type recombinase/integrase [Elusimicrobiota bacterium]